MKELLIVLLLCLLVGCTNDNYIELGYSSSQAKTIRKLEKSNQVFFSEYSDDLAEIIDSEAFLEDNIKSYIKFTNILSPKDIVENVNEGIISNFNYGTVARLCKIDNFDASNLRDYLKLSNRYSEKIIVKLVNENITEYEKIDKLYKDIAFDLNNVQLYLDYFEEKENTRELIEFVNTKRFLTYYEDAENADIDKYGDLVLVNKYNLLDSDYEPENLVPVENNYGVGYLKENAYQAYKKMQDEAEKQGYSFYITSPYRSYNTQTKLYNYYLTIDSQEEVDIYSARPGSSEHQLGLAVDILKSGYDFDDFYRSPEAEWLKENAYKYGYILRYPEEKTDITGYKFEPWHFRYVGEIAEDVYMSGLTYDEYFEVNIR